MTVHERPSAAPPHRTPPRALADPLTGVRNPARLKAVDDAQLTGHLGDPDLDAVVETLRLACGANMAVVNIVTADLQTYAAESGVGLACTAVPDHLSFCAEVVETGHALHVNDATRHPVYANNPLVKAGQVGAYAGEPLIDNGVVLGTVSVFNAEARAFSADVLTVLRLQARLASSVLALRRSAMTDALTGLPNRAFLAHRLEVALLGLQRHDGLVCLMYVDVDGFKEVNDTHGHVGGDAVLQQLGSRIRHLLRPTDTLARWGGDEFVILCEQLPDELTARRLARRLTDACNEPWDIQGHSVTVPISLGLAFTASAGTSAADLLRQADAAMYVDKQSAG